MLKKSIFVIQYHKGKKPIPGDHWDFRFVYDEKVLSFAIKKMMFPDKKSEKILAVFVDDNHPISHMSFEGILPTGDEVILVDKGECDILRFDDSIIKISIHGNHIKGTFNLINISDDNWLIIKTI